MCFPVTIESAARSVASWAYAEITLRDRLIAELCADLPPEYLSNTTNLLMEMYIPLKEMEEKKDG